MEMMKMILRMTLIVKMISMMIMYLSEFNFIEFLNQLSELLYISNEYFVNVLQIALLTRSLNNESTIRVCFIKLKIDTVLHLFPFLILTPLTSQTIYQSVY